MKIAEDFMDFSNTRFGGSYSTRSEYNFFGGSGCAGPEAYLCYSGMRK
jgi:hypothetical protein